MEQLTSVSMYLDGLLKRETIQSLYLVSMKVHAYAQFGIIVLVTIILYNTL